MRGHFRNFDWLYNRFRFCNAYLDVSGSGHQLITKIELRETMKLKQKPPHKTHINFYNVWTEGRGSDTPWSMIGDDPNVTVPFVDNFHGITEAKQKLEEIKCEYPDAIIVKINERCPDERAMFIISNDGKSLHTDGKFN